MSAGEESPGLFDLIVDDFRAHREGLFAQGFWALLVYRLSHPRLNCQNRVLKKLWYIPNIIGRKVIEITCGIMLPESAAIGRRLTIEHFGGIIVHGAATIGDDCTLRQGVTLGNKNHDRPHDAPRLGNRVDIGAGAKLLGAITIGDDVVVGANSVVTRDVPAGAVVAGMPARIINGDAHGNAEGPPLI